MTEVVTGGGPSAEQGIGGALAPLRARYAQWMALDADSVLADRDEPADEIRALQLIVRMERQQPPSWTIALAAAATAAARLCLDPRSEPGGEWHGAVSDYCAGHIRKVTRRARAGHWTVAGDLPGVLVKSTGTALVSADRAGKTGPAGETGQTAPAQRAEDLGSHDQARQDVGAQVRALVPGLVDHLDPRIARLQVGGTDVAPDELVPSDGPDPDDVLQVWLPPAVPMTLGKTMAQTGHAGMIAAALMAADEPAALRRWRDAGCPVRVHGRTAAWPDLLAAVGDGAAGWRSDRLVAVRDAGFTEIAPGTVTVLARAPR